ncbi:isopeptide-forming domain-containing fimbrial protein [Enterococcus sp. LJL90]
MIKRVKQWLLALLIAVLSVVGISQTVQAARVEVNPSNPIVASNDLFIPKNPSMGNPNDATIEVSGTSDYTLEGENSTTPSEAAFQQEYGSFKLKLNNRNDWSKLKVVVDHGTVATYDGQPVHVKLEYSNFVKSDKEPSDFYNRGNYLNLSKNIFSGFIFSGTSTFDVRLVVLDSNGQAISLDNAYMGFGSLNPSGSGSSDGAWSEGVGFNKINTNDYYVTNDTLLEEVVNPATGSGQLLLGQRVGSADTDDWNANYDKLGAINYNRATVSFKLSGTDNVFTIYSGRANNDAYTWNSMTTATLFSVEPEKPVKDVMNDAGASINGDLVQAGQTLTYEISQKVSVLGQDLLERYSKFMIEDQLDKNVTYVSSKLVDATGKTVDADGKYVYDESGHKLTYTASDKFLTEMPLEGETYRLLVTVKVNGSVADGVEINNKAMVTINNVSNSTNEVKNKVEIPKAPVKSIQDASGSDLNGKLILSGTSFNYKVTQQVTNGNQFTSWKITDKLDANVTYNSSRLLDESGKAVDEGGSYAYDEKSHTVTYTASKEFLSSMKMAGQSYQLEINVTAKKDIASGTVIENTATSTINDKDQITNKVTVTVENPKAPVKSIQDVAGTDLNGKLILSGTPFSYKVTQQVTNGNQFTSWKITDKLDANVTYNSSRLLDESGKAVDEGGSYTYDEKSHTVTYTSSKEFLSNMKMAGQSYQLEINVTAKKDIASGTVIKNTATSTINDKDQLTNEVTVTVPSLEAKIYKTTWQPISTVTKEEETADSSSSGVLANLLFNVAYAADSDEADTKTINGLTYTLQKQAGVTYELQAVEEILYGDGTVAYAAGEVADTQTTDASGYATFTVKMPGEYEFIEISAPKGIQVDPTPIPVTIEAVGETNISDAKQTDLNQNVVLEGTKNFEQEDGSFVAEDGATFALFNAEDISVDENVEVTADTKLADIELAEDGSFSHVTELINGEIYYISEQSTTENHVLKMNKMYFKYEATNSDENYVFHFYETGYTVEDVFIPYADVEALLSEEVAQEDETTNSTSTTESSNEGSSSSSEENQTTESSEVTTETTSSSEVTEEETVLADNLVSSHDAATDEQLLDIQNILITENSISKAIQKEDGSLVDNYDGLQDQETVIFVGTVNIGNNNAAGTPISFSDTLPEGLSYNSYTVSDSEGNDVTDQTTITVDDRAISVSVNQDYADTLSQTYLKWTIDTTYTHDTRLEGTTLENTMQLTVGDETTESNVVTLTPLVVQGGKLPQTGEIVTGLSLVGVLLLLNVLYFKKRQLADEEE